MDDREPTGNPEIFERFFEDLTGSRPIVQADGYYAFGIIDDSD